MIIRDKQGRLYNNGIADSYGTFVRKIGGNFRYQEWLMNRWADVTPSKQKRNDLCGCNSGLKYKKCCLMK